MSPKHFQQSAVLPDGLGRVASIGTAGTVSSQSPDLIGGKVTEQCVLPGHIPLNHSSSNAPMLGNHRREAE